MTTEERDQLFEWAHAHLEGDLTPEAHAQMEELIKRDPEARRVFADLLHDHATLHWEHTSDTDAEDSIFPFPELEDEEEHEPQIIRLSPALTGLAAGFMLLIVAGLSYILLDSPDDPSFATMESTKAASWASGDLPTADGARLGTGKLRLTEGLATVRFDSGAEVILEAPAELDLIDAMNCVLQSGTAVAEVPEPAIGFHIETPSAQVVDFGTRFVVNVDSNSGATKTQVLEGLVEVRHPKTKQVVRVEAGQRNYVAGDRLEPAIASPEEGTWTEPLPQLRRPPGSRILTTADGMGRDGYVHSHHISDHVSDVLLLVKNTNFERGPIRKAYLGFDLSTLDRSRIEEAELVLHFHPTGWGLASSVPDATFAVYGLAGDALDDWNPESLTWENAPANIQANGSLQRGLVHKLGTFEVGQGVQTGRFRMSSEELATFLREDSNDLSTLIVVRETVESEGGGLVHGFASSRHPILPGPTLVIRESAE